MDKVSYSYCDPDDLVAWVSALTDDDLSELSCLANERYSIPHDVFLRQCKRSLILCRHRYRRIARIYGPLANMYHWLFYWMIKLWLIFGRKHNNGRIVSDVVFELWSGDGADNYKYYQQVCDALRNKYRIAFAVFHIKINKLKTNMFKPFVIFANKSIDRLVAKEVLGKEYGKIPNNSTGVNSYYIWSLFLREYLFQKTRFNNISSKVYITAGDNYLSPLRYWIMKLSGIALVMAIQNGLRSGCVESGGAYYNEADVYEVFGNKQSELLQRQYCKASNWLPMGSITTLSKLENILVNDKGPILVIGHDFTYNIGPYNYDDYSIILRLVRKFAQKHKVKIVYKARTGLPTEVKQYKDNMENEWTVFDSTSDSYEVVAKASVCINYLSSLGTEAIGMGKRVLVFNFYNDDLVVDPVEACSVVLTKRYDDFERKLLRLMDCSDGTVDSHFQSLRNERMQIDHGVFKAIVGFCEHAMKVV